MQDNYSILEKLITENLQPSVLKITDESHLHHSGIDSGTHYSIIIVSTHFNSQSRIQRERYLHKLFSDLIKVNVRLSWRLYTPDEYASVEKIEPTPKCLGGYHK